MIYGVRSKVGNHFLMKKLRLIYERSARSSGDTLQSVIPSTQDVQAIRQAIASGIVNQAYFGTTIWPCSRARSGRRADFDSMVDDRKKKKKDDDMTAKANNHVLDTATCIGNNPTSSIKATTAALPLADDRR